MFLDKLGRLSAHRVVLASGSPRRSELLRGLGLEIEVIPSTFAEDLSKSAPHDYVISTARCKGREVVGRLASTGNGRRTLVVSADTVVVLDNAILEKPADEAHAVAMVSSLGGRSHNVVTGVCLFVLDEAGALVEEESFAEQTKVTFATLSDALVRAYVATGEPMDKAGGYGIQGRAGALIEGIEGCYFNVVGFPIHRFSSRVAAMVQRGLL